MSKTERKDFLLFFLGGFVFSLFVLFSYFVAREVFVQTDFDATVRLQDNISRKYDDDFSLLSDIGKFEISGIILLIVLFFTRKLIFGLVTSGMFGLLHVIELYGKFFVDQSPPPEFLIRTKKIIEFPQFHVRSDFSYPSGHAARATFLTVIIGFLIWRSKRIPIFLKMLLTSILIVYDSIMFVSRPYLGEHWMSDIIGGALLGGSLALLSVAFGSIRVKGILKKV